MGNGKMGLYGIQTAYCSEDGRFCGYLSYKMCIPECIQSSVTTVAYGSTVPVR